MGDAPWAGARARVVAGRFRHSRLTPLVRVEEPVAVVAVQRYRKAEIRIPDPNHAGVAPPGADHGARLDGRVVLLVDPMLGCDRRVVEELEEHLSGSRERGAGSRTLRAQTSDRVILTGFGRVDRAVVDQ